MSESQTQTLTEIVKDIKIAMLTTVDGDGHLTARPMTQQEMESDADLWFFVEKSSPTVANLANNPQAGIVMSSDDSWVSLAGTAEVVDDPERAQRLWNPMAAAWLPDGPDGATTGLIHFSAESGEYWTKTSGSVATALKFAKSKVTGDRPDVGESATVDLA